MTSKRAYKTWAIVWWTGPKDQEWPFRTEFHSSRAAAYKARSLKNYYRHIEKVTIEKITIGDDKQ